MPFRDELNKLREDLKGYLKEDASAEEIEKFSAFGKHLDNLESEHKKTEDNYLALKDKYINLTFETKIPDSAGVKETEEEAPQSFDELLNDFAKKNKIN